MGPASFLTHRLLDEPPRSRYDVDAIFAKIPTGATISIQIVDKKRIGDEFMVIDIGTVSDASTLWQKLQECEKQGKMVGIIYRGGRQTPKES